MAYILRGLPSCWASYRPWSCSPRAGDLIFLMCQEPFLCETPVLLLCCQARMLLLHLLLAALIAEDFLLGAPQFEALRAELKLPPQDLVTCYR